MPVTPKPIYSFVAGEVAPEFFARTDLSKYEIGAKRVKNFIVDYKGGLVSRPGSRFVAPLPEGNVRLFRFRASGNDYMMVFSDLRVRFVRNGGYLLNPSGAATISGIVKGQPTVIQSAAHGLASGQWVYITNISGPSALNNQYYRVANPTANDFELIYPWGEEVDTSLMPDWAAGGTVTPVVTLTTPYATAHLDQMRFEQRFDRVVITSLEHPPRELVYVSDTSWSLSEVNFVYGRQAPVAPTLTPSGAGTAGVAFCVSAVFPNGEESVASPYTMTALSVDYSAVAGSMRVNWPKVPGAIEYNVYRSLILPTGADISAAQETGFVGRTKGTQFIDNNIIPDFTKTPLVHLHPFPSLGISYIEVTAGGAGYTNASVVTVTDPDGVGFSGYPVVNAAGAITGIVIINGGSGYTAPSISVSVGAGATFSITRTPETGNYPRVFRIFQQRGVYAGSLNAPMTLWASKPGRINNFDVSAVVNAGDGYSFSLDSGEVRPIYHLVSLRSGLLVFHASGIVQLRAEEGKAVNATNALAEPQAYKGASLTEPLTVDLDVLFAQEQSSSVNAMMYTEYTNAFQLQDVSVLSNHLMGTNRRITRMELVPEPYKTVYCLREDGALLTLTYVREQEVFGWAQHATRGWYRGICAVLENQVNSLYIAVGRYINGTWRNYLEVVEQRQRGLVEDHWGVDCGIEYAGTSPAAELSPAAASGSAVACRADAAVFSAGDVGKIIYLGGGKGEITSFIAGNEIVVNFSRPIEEGLFEGSTVPVPFRSGEWTIYSPTASVGGLRHLEGETVSVLADGSAFTDLVVVDGAITLPSAFTKIRVGLGYSCELETLPLANVQTSIEGRRKDIKSAALRVRQTRGLEVGPDFSSLYEEPSREPASWGIPSEPEDGIIIAQVNGGWTEDATLCVRQAWPLPAHVLGVVIDVQGGDE